MIISFLNLNGWGGKTTLSINVACYLSHLGHKLLLLYPDNKRAIVNMAVIHNDTPLQMIGIKREIIAPIVTNLSAGYYFTIIDRTLRVENIMRSCLIAVDFMVIPISTSWLTTALSAKRTLDQYYEAIIKNKISYAHLLCVFIESCAVIGRNIRNIAVMAGNR